MRVCPASLFCTSPTSRFSPFHWFFFSFLAFPQHAYRSSAKRGAQWRALGGDNYSLHTRDGSFFTTSDDGVGKGGAQPTTSRIAKIAYTHIWALNFFPCTFSLSSFSFHIFLVSSSSGWGGCFLRGCCWWLALSILLFWLRWLLPPMTCPFSFCLQFPTLLFAPGTSCRLDVIPFLMSSFFSVANTLLLLFTFYTQMLLLFCFAIRRLCIRVIIWKVVSIDIWVHFVILAGLCACVFDRLSFSGLMDVLVRSNDWEALSASKPGREISNRKWKHLLHVVLYI